MAGNPSAKSPTDSSDAVWDPDWGVRAQAAQSNSGIC